MLPGRDGFSVVTELRARGVFTPVLLLTARDELEARVRGLEGGADDYLTKPFDLPELLARVHALIRRAELRHKDATLKVDDLTLDPLTRRIPAARRRGVRRGRGNGAAALARALRRPHPVATRRLP